MVMVMVMVKVMVKVIEIDSAAKKIGLSMKALIPAPEKPVAVEEEVVEEAPVTMSIDELIAKANEAEAAEATDAE